MPLAHITPPPRHKQNEGATFDVSWCLAKSPHHDDTSRHGTTRRQRGREGRLWVGGEGRLWEGGEGRRWEERENLEKKKNLIGNKDFKREMTQQ